MTLQSSGRIALSNVNVEMYSSSTQQVFLGGTGARSLFGVPSGTIYLGSNGYGKSTIIRTGLVFYVDAAFPASYPGSGTTWYDLSGTGAHLSLANSPTYNSTDGFFTFDGSSQYGRSTVLPTSANNNYALMAVVKPSNLSQQGFFLENGRDDGVNSPFNGYAFGIGSGTGGSGSKLQGLNSNLAFYNPNYTFGSTSSWYVCVQTRESGTTKWYVNGVQTSFTTTTAPVIPTQGCCVGAMYGNTPVRFFAGSIAVAAIYNTALTSTQVTTNFNILRGRYGI